MDNPKVSIIIPVYNTEKYLKRCIDSLLKQTYQNIELIFVDDGSKDNSLHILEEVAKGDARITVLSQKNAGPSEARNAGIERSTGKYIMFCDSDDTVMPNWCEELVSAIKKHPNGWVLCGINVLNDFEELVGKYEYTDVDSVLEKDMYYEIFNLGLSGSVYNKIYLTEVLKDKEITFDVSIRVGEDVIFNLEYFNETNKIVIITDNYYNYYRYETSETLTNRYHKEDFYIQLLLYKKRLPYIRTERLYNFGLHYWHVLSIEIDNMMKKNFEDSFLKKIGLVKTMLKCQEYQFLLEKFGKREMPRVCYFCLKNKKYFLYWCIQRVHFLKKRGI